MDQKDLRRGYICNYENFKILKSYKFFQLFFKKKVQLSFDLIYGYTHFIYQWQLLRLENTLKNTLFLAAATGV